MLKNSELIENLTIEQKLSILAGNTEDGNPYFNAKNLANVCFDTINGIVYPSFNSIANSWDTDLICKIATEIAHRAKNENTNVLVTPNLGIKMHPYGNGMTEDPYLCGKIAAATGKGISNAGVMPVLSSCSITKKDCEYMDLKVNKSFIRDYIVRPFEIALKENGQGAVMTCSSNLEGNYCDVNSHLITEILQEKKYFGDHTICQTGDRENSIKSLQAKNTLLLNADIKAIKEGYDKFLDIKKSLENGLISSQEFENACKDGTALSDEALDEAVDKYLSFASECENVAKYDNQNIFNSGLINVLALSLTASEESTVLLKNADNILPLKIGTGVAVIGQLAEKQNKNCLSFIETLNKQKANISFKYSGFSEGYNLKEERNDELIASACLCARSAEIVLLFLGFDESVSSGSQKLKLPANQLALLDALVKINKKIVAVISGDCALDTSFDEDCNALLLMPKGGTFTNNVILRILSGEINPSGKLANALYDNPDETYEDLKKRKDLGQIKVGAFFGYRYYDTAGVGVKYPFGYGLSYTQFSYSKIQASAEGVHFFVKNTGKMAGYETVQAYIGKEDSNVARPLKELRSFNRIYLEPGQSRIVNINLSYNNNAFSESSDGARKVENGIYTVYVGSSVSDIRLKKSFPITGVKFEGKPEHLSDFIQTKTNIISGKYTFKNDTFKKKKPPLAAIAFCSILLLTVLYNIVIAASSAFNIVTIFILVLLNALVPVAIVWLLIDNKKQKKERLEAENLRQRERENEIIIEGNLSIEKLFLEEFSEIEQLNEIAPIKERFECFTDESLNIKTITDRFLTYTGDRGIGMEVSSAHAILSALFSSRMLILKNPDSALLSNFLSHLCGFFGSRVNSGDISNAPVTNDIMLFEYCENILEKTFIFLPNLWFLFTLISGQSLIDAPSIIIENAFVIDVKLKKTTVKNEPATFPPVGFHQFLELGDNAEKDFESGETLFKKIDRLEEYVNSRAPYHIYNKEWREIEKFVAFSFACEGVESQITDIVVSAKLLPRILQSLKSKSFDENEFLVTIKKIFGEETTLRI